MDSRSSKTVSPALSPSDSLSGAIVSGRLSGSLKQSPEGLKDKGENMTQIENVSGVVVEDESDMIEAWDHDHSEFNCETCEDRYTWSRLDN